MNPDVSNFFDLLMREEHNRRMAAYEERIAGEIGRPKVRVFLPDPESPPKVKRRERRR